MMKKKRNIRKREENSDEEEHDRNSIPFLEENYHTQVQKAIEQKALKKKSTDKANGKKSKSVNSGSLLSFDEDGESGEVFQVKKSSASRKLKKTLEKSKRKDKQKTIKEEDEEDDVPELIVKPLPTQIREPKPNVGKNKDPSEGSIILNGFDAEAAAMAQDDMDSIRHGLTRLAPGVIPDASLIHAARKKRQQARETGQDYVPLDDTQRFRGDTSRLLREDDNDRSDSDDEGRMSFSVKQTTTRERVKEAIQPEVNSDDGSGDEDSHHEDLARWEAEQIKKGTSVPQASAMDSSSFAQSNSYQPADTYTYGGVTDPSWYSTPYSLTPVDTVAAPMYPDASNLPLELPMITVEEVKKKLKDKLEPYEDVHRAHQREYDTIEERMSSSALSSVDLKDSTGDLTKQYNFYQEMRGYVKDMVECLNEKMGLIDGLESAMMVLLHNRANKLLQRRQTDIKDQSDEFMNLSKKAATGANLAPSLEGKGAREEAARQRRAAEREGRRARRRRARLSALSKAHHQHFDGMSSDDEQTESEDVKFKTERDRIVTDSKAVFTDVVEDFHSLPVIQTHFEKWKFDQSESYTEAYIGLCLPKLYTPFVRLELINWNPLERICPPLETMKWYNTLLFYGFQESEELDPEDCDVKLVPSIIDKVVLPKLTDLVEKVWDPMSTSQTHRLVDTIQRLAEVYPTVIASNKNTQCLLKAVIARMRKTLDDDVYIPLFPQGILEHKGANQFMQRQFWSGVKLLGNILSWHGLVYQDVLIEIALDGLLNRYLLLSLQNAQVNDDSLAKCQKIVSALPRQWFQDIEDETTLRQLQSFCRYLLHAVNKMKALVITGNEAEKTSARNHVKSITKLLVSIHAMDHALSITSDYSIKEMKKILDK